MSRRRGAVLVLLGLVLGVGCVSRTTERPRRIEELPQASNSDRGTVTTQALIWFWQPEFWRP
jgi:hypothetical protein